MDVGTGRGDGVATPGTTGEGGTREGDADPAPFDRLARMAARLAGAPAGAIVTTGGGEAAVLGIHGPAGGGHALAARALCRLVAGAGGPVAFEDTRAEPAMPGDIGACAGVPLRAAGGTITGAVCALDTRPRAWSAGDLAALGDLALGASAEMALRATRRAGRGREERLRLLEAVAVHASDGVLITDAELSPPGPRIVYANAAFERMMGYAGDELLGRSPRLLQGPETDRRATAALGAALRRGEPARAELRNYRRDGTPSWVDLAVVPVWDETGRIAHFVSIRRETTGRREAEGAARARVETAEELAETRRDFVAAVSHELRTPLTAILGFAELLETRWEGMGEGQRRRTAGRIAVSARRQLRLVEDLLLAARPEGGEGRLRIGPVVLAPLAAQAAAEIRAAYRGQRIDLAGPAGLRARADSSRVAQIAANLLENAAKYSPEGSPVVVSWAAEGGMAALRVRDLGPGIGEGRELLFTRFGRLPGARARAGRVGTGLGLYLGRRLAAAMGGSLDLENTGPGGSTFLLLLPADTPDDRPGTAGDRGRTGGPGSPGDPAPAQGRDDAGDGDEGRGEDRNEDGGGKTDRRGSGLRD